MDIRAQIKEEGNVLQNIFERIKKRDFNGIGGLAIKNSTRQLTTNLISKIGSLLFMALIARLLLPELFGLYSLALGTIIFFGTFSELGLDGAMLTFVSKFILKKKNILAKSHFLFFLKLRLLLISTISLILVSSAYFISNFYYHKPIFFALLAGGLYLPLATMSRFFETLFNTNNDFKEPLKKEILFQISRLIIIPLIIFYVLDKGISNGLIIALLITLISFCYLISFGFLFKKSNNKINFLKSNSKKLTKFEKKKIVKFTFPLTVTILSGVFFGYIDTLMLGRFVSEKFLGYYGAAFALIGSAMAMISFISVALFPLFSQLKGYKLRKMFKQGILISFIFSFIAAIFTFFAAKYIILIIYGNSYLPAVIFLKYYAILLIIGNITAIYKTYLISQGRTTLFAKIIIWTTILNIVLNYLFITAGLKTGMEEAVLGACIATIISRLTYLGSLILFRNK